jgi:uncharacterized protein DUF4386
MTISETAVPVTAARPLRDVRGFWRVLLAVIAPLPMLFMGIKYVLSPDDGAETFEQTVTLYTQHKDQLELLEWLQVPFLVLLVPAAFAVAWVSRRGAPRLTTAGALVALGGLCAGFGILPGVPHPAHLTVRDGLDVAAVSKLDTAMGEHPIVQIGGLLFIVGITIGLLLLGLAMWRSGAAPAWMGWALALGGFTHPFMPGHVAAGVGLMVAAVGFAGASVALLRMRNEDFDLAPSR